MDNEEKERTRAELDRAFFPRVAIVSSILLIGGIVGLFRQQDAEGVALGVAAIVFAIAIATFEYRQLRRSGRSRE